MVLVAAALVAASCSTPATRQISLTEWQFSKDSVSYSPVTVPHSYNEIDGHSKAYYRGKGYYATSVKLGSADLKGKVQLLFEGAAQAATVYVNGQQAAYHKGGYTPFVVDITPFVTKGSNTISVTCDNTEDVNLAPVSSDFNKNGGLHNPVSMYILPGAYLCTKNFGLHRVHVSTPEVSAQNATVKIAGKVVGELDGIDVKVSILDADGKVCLSSEGPAQASGIDAVFKMENPHLWNGVKDPYLYTVKVEVMKGSKVIDQTCSRFGVRSFHMDQEKGFFLNGELYPLRGTSIHQDKHLKATALSRQDYIEDYEVVKELGCNFVRLAHYPHNDMAFDLCDEMGLIVQTEIPWVNICGVDAKPEYFENLHQQMTEMIKGLYNHPSIVFWGMWNELDTWGNTMAFQGPLDTKKVAEVTASLYDLAKSLDPLRLVGLTDDSVLTRDGYTALKTDYVSENRYNGWYYGSFDGLTPEIVKLHEQGFIVNISEYGAGVNPYCHTWKEADINNSDNAKHFEEWGNLFHESHLQQIEAMPFLNFTSIWILFDFPVAARTEGYLDSADGVNFTENDERKYTNDKGLVTRDRKVKKDAFYLYKSKWNSSEETVHITGKRLEAAPEGLAYTVKVYSNAKSLTLYHNGEKLQTLTSTGENTGVIWQFSPVTLKGESNSFKVVSDSGKEDEISLRRL